MYVPSQLEVTTMAMTSQLKSKEKTQWRLHDEKYVADTSNKAI